MLSLEYDPCQTKFELPKKISDGTSSCLAKKGACRLKSKVLNFKKREADWFLNQFSIPRPNELQSRSCKKAALQSRVQVDMLSYKTGKSLLIKPGTKEEAKKVQQCSWDEHIKRAGPFGGVEG